MPLADHVDYAPEEHESRLLCGDPKACAWEWINAYAKNLSRNDDDNSYYNGIVTAEELIEVGMSHVEASAAGAGWGDYINKGPLLDGVSTDPTFWDKLAALKGIEIPQKSRGNFFSCAC